MHSSLRAERGNPRRRCERSEAIQKKITIVRLQCTIHTVMLFRYSDFFLDCFVPLATTNAKWWEIIVRLSSRNKGIDK